MRSSCAWAVAAGAAALLALAAGVDAAGRTVMVRGADGRAVSALVFDANIRPAPAVVLVPMLGRPNEDWQVIGQQLASANITAMAIDLPGQYAPTERWQQDVLAAIGYLAAQPDVQRDALGVAGASLGASLAALAAATDARIRSLVLVSPSLDYRGVRIAGAMRAYGGRPALLIASRRDPYAARSSRELAADPPGVRELRWSEEPAHGSVLLARDPDLGRAIVEWFQRTLR